MIGALTFTGTFHDLTGSLVTWTQAVQIVLTMSDCRLTFESCWADSIDILHTLIANRLASLQLAGIPRITRIANDIGLEVKLKISNNYQVIAAISLTDDMIRIRGISIDGGVTWNSPSSGDRFNPRFAFSEVSSTSFVSTLLTQLDSAGCVTSVLLVPNTYAGERRIQLLIQIARISGNSLQFYIEYHEGFTAIRYFDSSSGEYVNIDARSVNGWYTMPQYAIIKQFYTWLGWNPANPTDYSTLSAPPTMVHFLHFMAGWSSFSAP